MVKNQDDYRILLQAIFTNHNQRMKRILISGGDHLYCNKDETAYQKNYPSGNNTLLRIVGAVLIAAGVLLLIFCIPGWAWFSLIGIILIVVGIILILQS